MRVTRGSRAVLSARALGLAIGLVGGCVAGWFAAHAWLSWRTVGWLLVGALVWMLLLGAGFAVAVVSGWWFQRRDRALAVVRSMNGVASCADVRSLLNERWSPAGDVPWTEGNGAVPISDARFVWEATRRGEAAFQVASAVVGRWIVEDRPAWMLVNALRVGITAGELTQYMDGVEPVRSTVEMLMALGPAQPRATAEPSRTETHSQAHGQVCGGAAPSVVVGSVVASVEVA